MQKNMPICSQLIYTFNGISKKAACKNWLADSKMHVEMEKVKNYWDNFEEDKQLDNFYYQYQYLGIQIGWHQYKVKLISQIE